MNTRLVFSIIIVAFIFLTAHAEPNGAVLYRDNIRYGHYNVPGDAGHHYFNLLEGPAWENKYCAFRMYIDNDDRNAIDLLGKLNQGAVLQDFSDPNADPHNAWSWGSDILSVGSAMGLGSFRLFYNGQWLNPQLPENLDSLVITINDSSVQTPKVTIGYYGWNIGSGNTITVLWTLSTNLNERPTHCELSIIGDYDGKLVAGMVNHRENNNNPNKNNVGIIQDENPPILATLGKQSSITEGYDDTLLMAIFTDPSYFDSFEKQGSTNLGMVLTPDGENKVRWSFVYSWAREQDPLYRHDNWKEELVPQTSINQQFNGVHTYSRLKSAVNTSTFIYTLNGRLLTSRIIPQRCSNGVYVIRKNSGCNGNGVFIHHTLNTRFSRQ